MAKPQLQLDIRREEKSKNCTLLIFFSLMINKKNKSCKKTILDENQSQR